MDIKVTDVRCQKGDAAFLIDDGKTSILYDTGFGFTGYAVAENIKKVLGEDAENRIATVVAVQRSPGRSASL